MLLFCLYLLNVEVEGGIRASDYLLNLHQQLSPTNYTPRHQF